MNELEFNIRLYLTGTMKSWTDRIDSTDQLTPQRFIFNAMTEVFDSLSDPMWKKKQEMPFERQDWTG